MENEIFYVNSKGQVSLTLKRTIGATALVVGVSLVVLGACSSLSKTVSGDWSCKAPGGTCAPTQNIDDRALSRVGGAISPAVAPPGSYITPQEGRVLVGGDPVRRSADKVLKITFPGRESPSGIRYQPTVAHIVVERGDWMVQQASFAPRQPKISALNPAPLPKLQRYDAVPDQPASNQTDTQAADVLSALDVPMKQIDGVQSAPNLAMAMIAGEHAQSDGRVVPTVAAIETASLPLATSGAVVDEKRIPRKRAHSRKGKKRHHTRSRTVARFASVDKDRGTCPSTTVVSVCEKRNDPATVTAVVPGNSAGASAAAPSAINVPTSATKASFGGSSMMAPSHLSGPGSLAVTQQSAEPDISNKKSSDSVSILHDRLAPVIDQIRKDTRAAKSSTATSVSNPHSGAE
jgi:hypothetical protein